MIEVVQFPARKDNYGYLLREPSSGLVAAVDTPEVLPLVRALQLHRWTLNFIFNTHHHPDHVGGNRELAERYNCVVYGSEEDAKRIPAIREQVSPGDEFFFGSERVHIIRCDGHTIGHIAYWMPASKALFVGDTIFSLGCGGLFEGTPKQMWDSLAGLRALPDDTLVYCAHEYTMANGAYALYAEPGNAALRARMEEVKALRAEGKPTVPSTLGSEKACNPFLRPESPELQKHVGKVGAPLWEVFGAIRADKDEFDSRN